MDTSEEKVQQVAFLPWAGLEEEISIGPVTLAPYQKLRQSDNSPAHCEFYNWLDKFFRMFKDDSNRPVDTITVCYKDDLDFKPKNAQEMELLAQCANAYYFSAVFGDLVFFHPPENAQKFELFTHDFKPEDRILSRPLFWPKRPMCRKNWHETVPGILEVFDSFFRGASPQDRNRLMRSIQWFWLVHVRRDYFSESQKIVMMTTAFEILLDFPEDGKSKYFSGQLNKLIATDKFKKEKREVNGTEIESSAIACWGYDFYQLRNDIVHGTELIGDDLVYLDEDYDGRDDDDHPKNRPEITHLMVADAVFCELVYWQLHKEGYWSRTTRELSDIFNKAGANSTRVSAESLLFDDYHGQLDWIIKKYKPENS